MTEIKDKFDLFLASKKIWAEETAGAAPLQRDYPLVLSLPAAPEASQATHPEKVETEESNDHEGTERLRAVPQC